MSGMGRRRFSRELKLQVIQRLEAGESGTALALEFLIRRTIIYRWRDAFREGGAEALRSKPGRPAKSGALAIERARAGATKTNGLAQARREIAELRRKVGQQQVDLDFFKEALRRIEKSHRPSADPEAIAYSPWSKR